MCHHWPGITPMNVMDLELRWWLAMVAAARQVREDVAEHRRAMERT